MRQIFQDKDELVDKSHFCHCFLPYTKTVNGGIYHLNNYTKSWALYYGGVMKKEQSSVKEVYQKLQTWLEDTKENEVRSIAGFLEQAKAIVIAAEQIPEQKVKQFIANLQYDLSDFYQQYQADIKHSVYLEILHESLWENLAKITDKSQVEWSELMDDFQHKDGYHVGDYVGFGQLQCQTCLHCVTYSHVHVVTDCINCGGKDFNRLSLTP